MKRAVFLDRDGTINAEVSYIGDPSGIRLEPGAAKGLRRLDRAGFLLVVVSNQSGVARGLHTEDDVRRVNERLRQALAEKGVALDGFYYCPHHPEGVVPEYAKVCDCRKPAPGLLLRAAKDAEIDLGRSYAVGDYTRDLEAGRAAGVRTVLVRTGFGRQSEDDAKRLGLADHVADDLAGAAEWIVSDAERRGSDIVDG